MTHTTTSATSTPSMQAKRVAPAPVEPVYLEGIRYEASGKGVVRAWDERNNKEIWNKTIYAVSYAVDLKTGELDQNP